MLSSSLALLLSIVVVLILVRKLSIGLSLFIGSALMAYLTLGVSGFEVIFRALISLQTIEIVVLVILAFTLGYFMEYFGLLRELTDQLSESLGAYCFLLIPLLVGLLPMPGGALISAVMLRPLMKDYQISPEKATLLNYWFRHVWVTFWPLYPNVIIGSAVLGVDYFHFAAATMPVPILATLSGLLMVRGMERKFRVGKNTFKAILLLYPVGILLFLSIFAKLSLLQSLIVAILALMLHKRAGIGDLKQVFRRTVDVKIVTLVFAVMVYRAVIESSGAAESLLNDISLGLPTSLAAFLLTLIVGFATGLEMSYSSIALPLLTSFTGYENVVPKNVLLVVSAGYLGVMLSPLHLCYVLTAEYFGSKIEKTYRQLLLLVLITAVAVWILYLA